jgi:hypothetical protein
LLEGRLLRGGERDVRRHLSHVKFDWSVQRALLRKTGDDREDRYTGSRSVRRGRRIWS